MPAINKKPIEAYKTISQVSEILEVPAYVLRFWEKEFKQIKPHKSNGRRHYLQHDIDTIATIKDLLYNKGHTIEGAKNKLKSISGDAEIIDREKLSAVLNKLKSLRDTVKDLI